ncbi:PH domain-containing protein [Anaeromyxobacter sp. PSR-1]|uniref:PH domain-containing protein n=1 Tax=Anaeromyxobacter sp. PSR-1 TaxID=1300915 RepID=UPI0005DB9BAB|nr:PH domain-containing protein [Anaeromyxobacter sp. PSR-1]GAO02080.1 hypothetical protein PSR1_00948 [Anaeromyxobacter sp. PSR-1]
MALYAARWERSLKVSTALFVGLSAAGAAVTAFAARRPETPDVGLPALLFAALPVFIVATAVAVWALAPSGFEIEAALIRVERPLLPIEIPLREVREVELLAPGALAGAIRLLGTSGAFGHYGRFRSRSLGKFRMYATRGDGLVRVTTDRDTFVLSPDPAEPFVEEVLSRAARARRVKPGSRFASPRR